VVVVVVGELVIVVGDVVVVDVDVVVVVVDVVVVVGCQGSIQRITWDTSRPLLGV
jgi:hypothetical protein